ncbi:MAG: MBL fold metallo-hydrolase [Polyangiaceae bacterium]|nr:MBL fold metallo-hydrolase [Polyangiaceae bacterium]
MIKVDSKLRRKVEWLWRRAEGALMPPAVLENEAKHLVADEAAEALRAIDVEHPSLSIAARLEALEASKNNYASRGDYIARFGCVGVRRFQSRGDVAIYLMPVETFPHHINNVYLLIEPGHTTLFDVGSGLESSRRDLALGFAVVRSMFGENARYETVDLAIVSHAHIDHFGGVNDLKVKTTARLAVHELDARVIAGFEERVVIACKDVSVFLRRAGVANEERARMLDLYMASRDWFRSVEVDRTLRDGDLVGGGHRVIHTPGHCPGQICLLVGDVLLTSDHVLSRTTPHQFPQAITAFGGLENYFHSLAKIRKLDLVKVALAGHEEPMFDLRKRVDEIAAFHRERLMKVRDLCNVPRTVAEVAAELFGHQEGYGTILAIEEAGAHVEYLHTLGKLRIANLSEVAKSDDPVVQYVKP